MCCSSGRRARTFFVSVSRPSWRDGNYFTSSGVHSSMRQIGFRGLLPLIFTLIQAALVWYTLGQQPRAPASVFREPGYRAAAYQEGVGAPMETFEAPPLNPVQKISIIVDLPAIFLATLIGSVLLPRNATGWMYFSIPLVSFLWYAIGRWLDGLVGYGPRFRLPRILRGFLIVIAVGGLSLGMAGLTPLYHHRTADTYWVFTGIALWAGLCLAIVFSSPARASSD